LLSGIGFLLTATALLLTGGQRAATNQAVVNGDLRIEVHERNPWTHLKLEDARDVFHFAVVSDRTGGNRPGVFAKAVAQLNIMRPAFVLSVGDLIPGFTDDDRDLASEWRTFQSLVRKLSMPFFYVPGNHDLASPAQEQHWRQRFGRRYYHFVFRDVLFLVLNADDPPGQGGNLGRDQLAYVRKTLAASGNVRWSIVVLHRPLWDSDAPEKNGWPAVEKALQGRSYTVFAGHMHRYRKTVRHHMNYYELATTGGGSRLRGPRYGEFDHFVWVTMTRDGPVVANLLLEGILTDDAASAN
jgi:hypothetical protein